MEATVWGIGKPQGNLLSGNVQMSAELKLLSNTVNASGIPMTTGLELGELQEPDPHRPSLILRRTGKQTLWEIAKHTGSTVAAIREANHLQEEPEEGQMLLIPIG